MGDRNPQILSFAQAKTNYLKQRVFSLFEQGGLLFAKASRRSILDIVPNAAFGTHLVPLFVDSSELF